MEIRWSRIRVFFLGIGLLLFLAQCQKEEIPPGKNFEEQARDQFYQLMVDWYLWYKELPDVNLADYATASELLDDLRNPKDRNWSYITTMEEFRAYYELGAYAGHGFGYSYSNDGKAYITFVFKDSDLSTPGVSRGWQIVKINGQVVQGFTNISTYMNGTTAGTVDNFEFRKPDGSTLTVSSTRKIISMNTVLYSDTLHVNGDIVGHLVFKSFIDPSINELDSVFGAFKALGVNKLILDLRYNGGGKMSVATKLASMIVGQSNAGNVFIQYLHNDKKTSYNQSILFESDNNALNLDEVIIFSSRATASASEAIINGIKPYIDVALIGDPTYGKPVGMYSWTYADEYVFVPVCFSNVNANGEGEYFDGITPSSYMEDGLLFDFSDRDEDYLKEAINYIITDSFTGTVGPKSLRQWYSPYSGLKFEIGAE